MTSSWFVDGLLLVGLYLLERGADDFELVRLSIHLGLGGAASQGQHEYCGQGQCGTYIHRHISFE
ncbi:hypothetical protein [Pseudomonas amygdali]|uniref:hypothetical protein n=1 Tax=Pseudomonas amygdali TaxID=47877 RepID=UPI0015D4F156|nr:hypothetical protein [Pseudomonas amygdali]